MTRNYLLLGGVLTAVIVAFLAVIVYDQVKYVYRKLNKHRRGSSFMYNLSELYYPITANPKGAGRFCPARRCVLISAVSGESQRNSLMILGPSLGGEIIPTAAWTSFGSGMSRRESRAGFLRD